MKTLNREFVEEHDYGVYIWRDANGKIVADEDYNVMCIRSKRGDQSKIDQLAAAAKSYGIEGGHAEFRGGQRPISQEEWEEQMQRQREGYVADPYDLGALIDEYKARKQQQ